MTRKSRRRLFYALVLIFLIIGTGGVGYAEGWRLDFHTWHLEKVGEIFVRSYPDDATITLGKKNIKNQSGFLSRGTLIPDLLPGSYTLSLAAPGFATWHENASVQTSLVAQFKYAVLIPQNATTVIEGPVTDAGLTSAGFIIQYPGEILKSGTTTIATGQAFFANPNKINSWPNVLIKNTKNTYSVYDPTTDTSTNLSSLFLKNGIDLKTMSTVIESRFGENIAAADNLRSFIIINEDSGTTQLITTALTGTQFTPSIGAAPGMTAWASFSPKQNTSLLNVFDSGANAVTTSTTAVAGKTIQVQWIQNNQFGVLQNDGSLYRYDAGSAAFTKVADNVINFSASNDGNMLAAVESTGFEAFNRATQDYYRFNLPEARTIQKVIWYKDDSHLFIVYPDHVAFLDLNDASLANFATVSVGTSPLYDSNANALYLIATDGDLIRFDFPS